MAKSVANIDAQIAKLREQRKAQKQRERREERQRARRAQQKLGVDLAAALGASTEAEVEQLRAVVMDADTALPGLRQRLGAASAPVGTSEIHRGGGEHGIR